MFLLHGMPGSRLGPAPRGMVLYQRRMQLISYDRPGYGGSDRLPGRRVKDVIEDVRAIADSLGLERFAVVGRSGGAPHALACAALMPDRVTRSAALVSLAPRDAEGLDWFDGMAASNVLAYSRAVADPDGLAESFISRSAEIRQNPVRLLDDLRRELTDSDRTVVNDAGIRTMLLANFREGLRTSAYGWIDDALAFCRPWGFDPADITCPVMLWHGVKDVFSPWATPAGWPDRSRAPPPCWNRRQPTSTRCPCFPTSSTGCWTTGNRARPPPADTDGGARSPAAGAGDRAPP